MRAHDRQPSTALVLQVPLPLRALPPRELAATADREAVLAALARLLLEAAQAVAVEVVDDAP